MTMTSVKTPSHGATRVHRVEVQWRDHGNDPLGASLLDAAREQCGNVTEVRSARIFLIEAVLTEDQLDRVATALLADPLSQTASVGATTMPHLGKFVEVHFKPGVMDPVAQSTAAAIREMLLGGNVEEVQVRTGFRLDLLGSNAEPELLTRFAESTVANPVIHEIHTAHFHPEKFPAWTGYTIQLIRVPLRNLDDDALVELSRTGHLFLNLSEMRAIQAHFRNADRDPTDAELETLAQTWSEHCVHKTLKSRIRYTQAENGSSDHCPGPEQWLNRPGHRIEQGGLVIDNLIANTIVAATNKLMTEGPSREFCISVFKDNAGIVRFDEDHCICIKVETHNHPSAIEPYGGAATGIGGCIRDIMGTGLAARPVANTDVFCVGHPDQTRVPNGVIPPRRVLQRVVAGVRDYGNRMGIPTVNGAVAFHDDYIGNPLVFCGCIGLIPRHLCFGDAQEGDHIFVLGGSTGRDGIHGATFSSSQLTDGHADEFPHAVQIGNAITQKKVLDVILQARDDSGGCLFNAITDCGAGGLSSAIGEMGEAVGARVALDRAPLKYTGLTYTEIWISEAQERMVLAVPPHHVERLQQLCGSEDVQWADLGTFGSDIDDAEPTLRLLYLDEEVACLAMTFLHDGIPTPTRQACWAETAVQPVPRNPPPSVGKTLEQLLAHPNIASKHWIVRQYDHEVQGGSVIKPLVGPFQDGPSDAAVVRPKLGSLRGVAVGCGLQIGLSEKATGVTALRGDSYWATLAAIDEAVRNVVCVGADPLQVALLDNFCWPDCSDANHLGSLVRAAEACYDGALAYTAPFVSGKDSLSNQFRTDEGRLITIPPTLLITALGIVPDVACCQTMDAKQTGNILLLIGRTTEALGGSHYAQMLGFGCDLGAQAAMIPHTDLEAGPRHAAAVASLIRDHRVVAVHDCSDGGLLVAAAEMSFSGRRGLELDLGQMPTDQPLPLAARSFAETPSRYLLEVPAAEQDTVRRILEDQSVPFATIGRFVDHPHLQLHEADLDVPLDRLRAAWMAPLDF